MSTRSTSTAPFVASCVGRSPTAADRIGGTLAEPTANRRPRSGTASRGGGHGGTGLAIATALAMIAYQVAAKATRDALFLSSFSAAALPAMTIASATLSVIMAFAGAKALSRFGPERVIPDRKSVVEGR